MPIARPQQSLDQHLGRGERYPDELEEVTARCPGRRTDFGRHRATVRVSERFHERENHRHQRDAVSHAVMDAHEAGAAPAFELLHDLELPSRAIVRQRPGRLRADVALQFVGRREAGLTRGDDMPRDVEVGVVLPVGIAPDPGDAPPESRVFAAALGLDHPLPKGIAHGGDIEAVTDEEAVDHHQVGRRVLQPYRIVGFNRLAHDA